MTSGLSAMINQPNIDSTETMVTLSTYRSNGLQVIDGSVWELWSGPDQHARAAGNGATHLPDVNLARDRVHWDVYDLHVKHVCRLQCTVCLFVSV